MKWPGKTVSAPPFSEPLPALILLVTGMVERGCVWHKPNSKPRGLQRQGTAFFPL